MYMYKTIVLTPGPARNTKDSYALANKGKDPGGCHTNANALKFVFGPLWWAGISTLVCTDPRELSGAAGAARNTGLQLQRRPGTWRTGITDKNVS
jgi:hypothetical protein